VGIDTALEHAEKFGFDRTQLPRDLSLSLGSGAVTPLEVARGYAVFANGGYLVEPYLVQRIEDSEGTVLFEADPAVACPECAPEVVDVQAAGLTDLDGEGAEESAFRKAPRTVDAENIYLMTTMMQDVVRSGTGRRALQIGRSDLAGKTGTTNDQRDAWFSGFNPAVVTTTWVGFDTPRPLGRRETGAGASLPIWVDYMEDALKGVPEYPLELPPGMVTVRIDPVSGLLADAANPDAIYETFRADNVPETESTMDSGFGGSGGEPYTSELF
jgi:penicillin-binding protein 1A